MVRSLFGYLIVPLLAAFAAFSAFVVSVVNAAFPPDPLAHLIRQTLPAAAPVVGLVQVREFLARRIGRTGARRDRADLSGAFLAAA